MIRDEVMFDSDRTVQETVDKTRETIEMLARIATPLRGEHIRISVNVERNHCRASLRYYDVGHDAQVAVSVRRYV